MIMFCISWYHYKENSEYQGECLCFTHFEIHFRNCLAFYDMHKNREKINQWPLRSRFNKLSQIDDSVPAARFLNNWI